MSHRVNIKRIWQDICDTIEPAARLSLVREAIESVRVELGGREEEERSLLAEQRDLVRHPGRGAGVRLQVAGLLLLALVLLAADTPLQFALNAASLPQIPKWIWAATAPAFAVGLGALVHGAAIAFLYDKTRPARSIRICRRLTWLTFVAAVLAGGVILFARVATPDAVPYIVDLASISLWVLAETLPTSAGLALAWAHFLSLPAREDRRLRKTRQRKTELERFLDKLTVEENALSLAEETAEAQPVSSANAAHIAKVVGVLLFALTLPAQGQVCGLAVDRTISQSLEHRGEAAELTYASLHQLVEEFGCVELVVASFTDEGRWAPRRWLKVPDPIHEPRCATGDHRSAGGSKQLLLALAAFRTHFEQEAVRSCLAHTAIDSARFRTEWTSFAAAVRAVLTEPLVSHETQTDIAGVIDNIVDSGANTVVAVTDGIDTAHDGSPSLALPPSSLVVVLLVPATPEYGGREATDRAGRLWESLGPNVVAIPYTELASPSAWARLASRRSDRQESSGSTTVSPGNPRPR